MNKELRKSSCILRRTAAVVLCFVLSFTLIPWTSGMGYSVNAEESSAVVLDEGVSEQPGVDAGESVAAEKCKEYKDKEFVLFSEIEGVEKYTFDYNDEWLFNSSYDFNYDLLKMSARVASTSFYKYGIRSLINTIDYKNQVYKYPYNNKDTNPDINDIKYAIASKNIENDSGEKASVIMVAIRGGGYNAEWGGNAYMGAEGDHNGFDIAAETVFKAIQDYLVKYEGQLPYEKKIWVCGYSRAAAVANLLGCKLNEKSFEEYNNYKFDKEDVFAFCFEAPQGAIKQTKEYKNIVNIVNPIDLVTKFIMSELGFCRSGNSYYLPSLNADGAKYIYYKSKMVKEYEKLLAYNGLPESKAKTLTDSTYAFQNNLDKLSHFLATEIGSRENYVANQQDKAVEHIKEAMGTGEYWRLIYAFYDTLPGVLAKMGVYWVTNPQDFTLVADVLMKNYAEPHYPELIISWLDSMDADSLKDRVDKVRYKKLVINSLADVVVTDEVGNVVAKIVNGVLDTVLQKITAYVDEDGQVVLSLPEEGGYEVKVSEAEDDEVTIIASCYNYETGEDEQVVRYENVAVGEDETVTYSTGKNDEGSIKGDTLFNSDNVLIKPDAEENGSDVTEWTVTVESEGSGSVSGGGVKLDGEFARLTAMPELGQIFRGWYKDGKLVSKRMIYRMKVKGNSSLVAKFSEYKIGWKQLL